MGGNERAENSAERVGSGFSADRGKGWGGNERAEKGAEDADCMFCRIAERMGRQ